MWLDIEFLDEMALLAGGRTEASPSWQRGYSLERPPAWPTHTQTPIHTRTPVINLNYAYGRTVYCSCLSLKEDGVWQKKTHWDLWKKVGLNIHLPRWKESILRVCVAARISFLISESLCIKITRWAMSGCEDDVHVRMQLRPCWLLCSGTQTRRHVQMPLAREMQDGCQTRLSEKSRMGFYTETRLRVFAVKKLLQPVSVSEDTDDVYKGPRVRKIYKTPIRWGRSTAESFGFLSKSNLFLCVLSPLNFDSKYRKWALFYFFMFLDDSLIHKMLPLIVWIYKGSGS